MHSELDRFLREQLGDYSKVADRSWGHGGSEVWEVRDRDGRQLFAKRQVDPERHRVEEAAYRRWVPALLDRAPRLLASDPGRQSLLLTAVPGTLGLETGLGAEVQHQGGALLRQLHDAEPPVPWPDFVEHTRARLERWLHDARGLLGVQHVDLVRRVVGDLDRLPTPSRVPCHLDFSLRNWLVDDHGRVSLIDFEWAALDVWVNDLARLYYGPWQGRPDLRDAFLDGYGRALGDHDLAILSACAAARAVFLIVWARQHGETDLEASARRQLDGLIRGGT